LLVFQSGPSIVIFRDFFKFFAILFRGGNENWIAPEHIVITGDGCEESQEGAFPLPEGMTEDEIPMIRKCLRVSRTTRFSAPFAFLGLAKAAPARKNGAFGRSKDIQAQYHLAGINPNATLPAVAHTVRRSGRRGALLLDLGRRVPGLRHADV
jgi:hypothetical protein